MTFKQFFKESPDVVYSPSRRKLTWHSNQAIAFGTIHGIKGLSPFFVYSLRSSQTHFEMIENIVIKLESTFNDYSDDNQKINRDDLAERFERVLTFDRMWRLPALDANKVSQEIVNSSFLMSKIKSNLLLDYIHEFSFLQGKGSSEFEQDLTNPIRTKLYKNSGRIWPESKVISFWLTSEQLTPEILDNVFNQLKITDKDKYYIDVVNMEEMEKEETKNKDLPSYKEYKTRKSTPAVSDEQRKRAQEFMAKQHGVAGAQKARFETDKELPEVGAKKYALQKPLQLRQQLQTSESLEIESSGVYEDEKKIADIEIDEASNITKQDVISYFEDEESYKKDPAVEYIKSLRLPKTFTYVWIQFIKLLPKERGKGKGSEILNTLAMNYPPGTLLALSAEEVSGGKTASSLEMLKKFYRQNGFYLVKSRDKVFGFRVV